MLIASRNQNVNTFKLNIVFNVWSFLLSNSQLTKFTVISMTSFEIIIGIAAVSNLVVRGVNFNENIMRIRNICLMRGGQQVGVVMSHLATPNWTTCGDLEWHRDIW